MPRHRWHHAPARTLDELNDSLRRLDQALNAKLESYCAAAVVGNVANGGTAETDLLSAQLAPHELRGDQRFVRVSAWGTLAANANVKTVRLYFGSQSITVVSVANAAHTAWHAEAIVVHTANDAQEFHAWGLVNGGSTDESEAGRASTTEAEAAAITIKVTGQSGTGSNDVVARGLTVEVMN